MPIAHDQVDAFADRLFTHKPAGTLERGEAT